MAVLQINPTRMELINLKRRLITARRGHKLLKDKRDELMRRFLELVRENKRLRREIEDGLKEAQSHMALAGASVSEEVINTALLLPKQEMFVGVIEKNVMSVLLPQFDVKYKTGDENDIYSYGYAFTSSDLDAAVRKYAGLAVEMLELAQIEKSCALMSGEIEKTRRRVNALEYIIIPQYEETIRYITMKLDENERSATTRLMKVKNMMLENAHHYSERGASFD